MSHDPHGHADLVKRFDKAQTELVIQTADLPLKTLADMVETGAIDLQPGFQRRERWDQDKQSALMESFLLNVPVPPIYLSEEEDGTYSAIDGKQRLRSIAEFMCDRLKLRNLQRLAMADGLIFSQMPPSISNALQLRPYLRVITLLKQTAPTLKYEVFLRLNVGGESLNNQEIRNVAFRGPLNDLIYELGENRFLRQQLKISGPNSSAYKKMHDAEYVLRFLTLRQRWEQFSGQLAYEMNSFMLENQNASDRRLEPFSTAFTRAIDACKEIWGPHAFKRPDGHFWRDQLLAGMFDAQMISVDRLSDARIEALAPRSHEVLEGTRRLFSDEEFEQAVRTGTNTPARIRYRVEATFQLLENL